MAFYFQGRRRCGIVANGDDGNFAVSVRNTEKRRYNISDISKTTSKKTNRLNYYVYMFLSTCFSLLNSTDTETI